MSLVTSSAYPPSASLDTILRELLYNAGHSFGQLSMLDQQAAATLYTLMSGYATLRKFYDLRDLENAVDQGGLQGVSSELGHGGAAALLAVIKSASDNIDGGLFDESRTAIVPFDGLLTLLGEILSLINGMRLQRLPALLS